MQFHDYHTHYQIIRMNNKRHWLVADGPEKFGIRYVTELEAGVQSAYGKTIQEVDPITPALILMETKWHALGRPYFNVWPSIIPALLKLRLDADASYFRLPLEQLLIRFPKTQNPLRWADGNGREWSVRAVVAENATLKISPTNKPDWYDGDVTAGHIPGIAYWIDVGEPLDADVATALGPVAESGQLHSLLYKHIVCVRGRTLEWSFDNIPSHESAACGLQYPDRIVRDVARLICTLCIMADDDQMVEPIVLKADEEKYERTRDAALVEKAKRRGNYGFDVGRSIEVVPHVRAASPAALYWTGEGRTIPKIRFRRGTVVHRKRLASMPTGFLDKEEDQK